jgi:hypothetical protein
MIANSAIHFYKNDFASAISDGDPKTSVLNKESFIQLLPTETFTQKTSGIEDISFVADIKVELICKCGYVKKNISEKFKYNNTTDENGIKQIDFEFGNINEDFWTETLYLKITDILNGNIFYSNGFFVTEYLCEETVRFDYTSEENFENVFYKISPLVQSIRLQGVYFSDIEDDSKKGQYIQSSGHLVNYKQIETKYDKYLIRKINIQTKRNLEHILRHPIVYIDGKRVQSKDGVKKTERVGQTNWFPAEFLVNPQSGTYSQPLQLLQGLKVLNKYIIHQSKTTINRLTLNNIFFLSFNKRINTTEAISGYILSPSNISYNFTFDVVNQDASFDIISIISNFEVGTYNIVVFGGNIFNELEFFQGYALGEWTFDFVVGDFNNLDFNSNDFSTN